MCRIPRLLIIFGMGIPMGNTFSFEPHDLTFLKVTTITLSYQDDEIPPGADEGNILIVGLNNYRSRRLLGVPSCLGI